MAEVKRGLSAIKEASERKGSGSGDFKPFCPKIAWKDGDEKHILILTDLDELQEYAMHEFIKTGTRTTDNGEEKPTFSFFISRKDPSIGETYDDLQDRLEQNPRMRFLGVGVELEPVYEAGKGGKSQLVGFEVATDTYTAKGDDDEDVEVEYPKIGVISQSASNYWNWLANFQEKHANVNEVAFEVTRAGGDADTAYQFVHFKGEEINLEPLIETIGGVSYLTQDDEYYKEVQDAALEADSVLGSAQVYADALLAKYVEEVSDIDTYRALVTPIQHIDNPWAKKGKKKSRSTGTVTRASSRTKTPDTESVSDEPKTQVKTGSSFQKLREKAREQAEAAAVAA